MELSEAEIQVLASILRVERSDATATRAAVEKRGERYWVFKEDWSGAFGKLVEKGLIAGNDDGFRLTGTGRPVAAECDAERPDMYWYYYQKFYPAARASAAHTELCERVFGQDLCQEGQTDMASLKRLVDLLELEPGERMLDLGCGAGVIAEYVSETTGAQVTGLDYAASAIAEAKERTADKRDRLSFLQGNFNALDFAEASFDAVISLDTLYWASDLEALLRELARILRPGGRMGIFLNHEIGEGEPRELLEASNGKLAKALVAAGLPMETFDYTREIGEFWQRLYAAATDLKEAFEAEGNGFIAESLIREAEEDYLPDVNSGRIARYLYLVRP